MMASVEETGAEPAPRNPLHLRFAALHSAADALRVLLGEPQAEPPDPRMLTILPTVGAAGPEAAIGDLCEMMEQGLFAVLRARETGAEAHIAARTLLTRFEVEHARIFAPRTPEAEQA